LGRVFNFGFGHWHAEHFLCYQEKLPNLKLKTWPKQPLGSLQLVIALPTLAIMSSAMLKDHLHWEVCYRNRQRFCTTALLALATLGGATQIG